MKANDKLADLAVAHALNLIRFGNGAQRDMLRHLRELEKDVAATLASRAALIGTKGFDRGPATTARYTAMLEEIRALIDNAYSRSRTELEATLAALAPVEAAYQARALTYSIPKEAAYQALLPSPSRLQTIVTSQPFEGRLISEWFAETTAGTKARVTQTVRLGMSEGWTIDQMVRRVRQNDFEKSKASARSMVRTLVNGVANEASQETWSRNSDVIRGWQFLATLDSRTTLICASLDGQVFPLREGPIPPRHRGCRSTTIPVLHSADDAGFALSGAGRASMDGKQADAPEFEAWMERKGDDFARSYLGKSRYELWRSGKLSLQDFVRNDTDILTLDELRKLYPSAFS